MRFVDVQIYKEERISIGCEMDSGMFYLSIPVRNPYIEYEEYYELTPQQFEVFKEDVSRAQEYAEKCRSRQLDNLLIQKPGKFRGEPI